ncbi:hypothetical protein [Dendronalium sp. ChiSLP03b]|nr:hypothetical protein [Dendronalium sp. ChiSLP03b]MDZ8208018.1 hypothetical protein [Dendronalium sp. ChiSLP03b]
MAHLLPYPNDKYSRRPNYKQYGDNAIALLIALGQQRSVLTL